MNSLVTCSKMILFKFSIELILIVQQMKIFKQTPYGNNSPSHRETFMYMWLKK